MAFKRVSAAQGLELSRIGYVIVDVRPPDDFRKGHPQSARNVPFYFYTDAGGIRPNPDFVATMSSLFKPDAKLLLVDKVGKRSPDAAQALLAAGFTDVCDLSAGYKGILGADGRCVEGGWETLGLPGTMTEEAGYAQIIAQARKALKQ